MTQSLKTTGALNQAIDEEMALDDDVVIFGEDIGVYGGVWGVSRRLQKKYGVDRVFDTPLSEIAIVGTAIGAAMAGLRPVIELMYIDFSAGCMDPLVNQAAKIHLMSGGQVSVPITVVAPCGSATSEGAQHSQSLEAWFLNAPGWKVVMPSIVSDVKGLMKSAIRDGGPVLLLWHKALFHLKGTVPDGDGTVPLGEAAVRRSGAHVTVVAYSLMVHRVMQAAEELGKREGGGIDVEVIDPRTLNPFDIEAVCKSVRKTGRLLVVHESPRRCGVGADIVRQVVERDFGVLKTAPRVLAGADVPIPFAKPLENACIPQVETIKDAVIRMYYESTR